MRRVERGEVPYDGGTAVQDDAARPVFRGHGDVDYVCVECGNLLASAHNRRELDGDPAAHAELLALRDAARQRGHWRLDGCTLIVTLEPCLMCAGGILNARITRLVYGTDDPKAGAVRSRFAVLEDPRLNHRVEVLAGVEREACAESLRAFFASLRAEGQK